MLASSLSNAYGVPFAPQHNRTLWGSMKLVFLFLLLILEFEPVNGQSEPVANLDRQDTISRTPTTRHASHASLRRVGTAGYNEIAPEIGPGHESSSTEPVAAIKVDFELATNESMAQLNSQPHMHDHVGDVGNAQSQASTDTRVMQIRDEAYVSKSNSLQATEATTTIAPTQSGGDVEGADDSADDSPTLENPAASTGPQQKWAQPVRSSPVQILRGRRANPSHKFMDSSSQRGASIPSSASATNRSLPETSAQEVRDEPRNESDQIAPSVAREPPFDPITSNADVAEDAQDDGPKVKSTSAALSDHNPTSSGTDSADGATPSPDTEAWSPIQISPVSKLAGSPSSSSPLASPPLSSRSQPNISGNGRELEKGEGKGGGEEGGDARVPTRVVSMSPTLSPDSPSPTNPQPEGPEVGAPPTTNSPTVGISARAPSLETNSSKPRNVDSEDRPCSSYLDRDNFYHCMFNSSFYTPPEETEHQRRHHHPAKHPRAPPSPNQRVALLSSLAPHEARSQQVLGVTLGERAPGPPPPPSTALATGEGSSVKVVRLASDLLLKSYRSNFTVWRRSSGWLFCSFAVNFGQGDKEDRLAQNRTRAAFESACLMHPGAQFLLISDTQTNLTFLNRDIQVQGCDVHFIRSPEVGNNLEIRSLALDRMIEEEKLLRKLSSHKHPPHVVFFSSGTLFTGNITHMVDAELDAMFALRADTQMPVDMRLRIVTNRNLMGSASLWAEAQRVYQNLTLHVHSQGRACATCEEKAFSDAVASHLANFTIGNNVAWRFHNLELGRQKLEEGLQKQVLVDDGPWHPKDKLLHAIRSKQARRFRRRLVLPARTFAWNIHPTGARGSFLHSLRVSLVPCLVAIPGGQKMGTCNPGPYSNVLNFKDVEANDLMLEYWEEYRASSTREINLTKVDAVHLKAVVDGEVARNSLKYRDKYLLTDTAKRMRMTANSKSNIQKRGVRKSSKKPKRGK